MERRHLTVLILLIAIAAVVYALSSGMNNFPPETQLSAEQIRNGEVSSPTMTDTIQAKLAASAGFAALASYTDTGFEPALIEIDKGDTIRFTNNSTQNLWLVANGEKVAAYPRTKQGCGSSDLDSCGAIEPRDFWEFTFEKEGTWEVVNSLDMSKSMFVRVE